MSTKKLAKELGLLRQRSKSSNGSKKSLLSNQIFSYLIVIDFESTCWREKTNYSQEIIEFPAVLLNTSTGEVESEFHTYVQPQEHPILSEFCTELTGITQIQVEAGIPLQIGLSRFSRWLQNLQLEMGVVFPNRPQRSSAPSPTQKLCTFVTWSDWDLGVCLQYECKRKQLHKPDVLNSWIDLRSTYKLFYDRKPKGLNGALQDLGIQFSGREHSGLDDSRNTAQLAARMMRDGCVMKITRSPEKMPSRVKPMFGNTTADNKKSNKDKEENEPPTNKPSSSQIPPESRRIKSHSGNILKDLDPKRNSGSVQICQSLISPKTLLNGTTTPLWGCGRRSVKAVAVANISSSGMMNCPSSRDNNSSSSSSLVLCSTTLGCLSHLPQTHTPSNTGAPVEEEGAELLVETEDRCGSYDDVVLEGDDDDVDRVADFDSGCHVWEKPDEAHSSWDRVRVGDETRDTVSDEGNFKTQKMTSESNHLHIIRQHSLIPEPNTYFAVPEAVSRASKSNRHKTGLRTSPQVQEEPDGPHKIPKANPPSLLRHNPFIPEKTSSPHTSFVRPQAVVPKHRETPKSSFTIFTDPAKPSRPSSGGSFCASKNVLSSLANHSSVPVTAKGGQRITSPLCACGRRAKRQVVSNGGPNQGRGFFCCPVRRSGSGGGVQKGCEFFKWESALLRGGSVGAPAAGSSVSLCQVNATLSRPAQRSTLRKSY
ncbi:ERI1 exoribonuclease 2 [Cebidichthys violaceus]|uniref:ERI1 exoribonuclease 2 n=1 Tax=Cebidichthys violaceus TaxID=271503 RepID=UPI0035CB005D